jgi:hypothetical protein
MAALRMRRMELFRAFAGTIHLSLMHVVTGVRRSRAVEVFANGVRKTPGLAADGRRTRGRADHTRSNSFDENYFMNYLVSQTTNS